MNSAAYNERQERTAWFRESRFGLFIHWGLYAIPARGEWVRSVEQISVENYQPYFDQFRPDSYNPREWARMAKQAGMKYAVMTAKHHDGFCLFDSALTDYKATRTPAGRDLVREYVEAFRAEGLGVGLYYSLLDWLHPGYPHFGHRHHPMRNEKSYEGKSHDFGSYISYFHGQVRELLSNYGKIDILWFDFSYEEMTGKKWEAEELVRMVRELQPDVVIDNRLGGNAKAAEPEFHAGDFETPEQMIPAAGLVDEVGRPIPWEACVTQNGHWGFHREDAGFLSGRQTIRNLVNCVSKGGNLLINTGPDARGLVPALQQQILKEVGEWMKLNGESIYGAGPAPFPKPEWGRYTMKGNRLFCHVQEPGMGTLILPGLARRVRNPRMLATGHEVVQNTWFSHVHPNDAFMVLTRQELEWDPVVEWELTGDA